MSDPTTNVPAIVVICQVSVKFNDPKKLYISTFDAYARSPEEAGEMANDMARRQTLAGHKVLGTKIHAINPFQAVANLQQCVPDFDNAYRVNHPHLNQNVTRGVLDA